MLARSLIALLVFVLVGLQVARLVFAFKFTPKESAQLFPLEATETSPAVAADDGELRAEERWSLWTATDMMRADQALGYLVPFLLMFTLAAVFAATPSTTGGSFLFGALLAVGLLALNMTQTAYLGVELTPCAGSVDDKDKIISLLTRGQELWMWRLGELALHLVAMVPIFMYLRRTSAPAAVSAKAAATEGSQARE